MLQTVSLSVGFGNLKWKVHTKTHNEHLLVGCSILIHIAHTANRILYAKMAVQVLYNCTLLSHMTSSTQNMMSSCIFVCIVRTQVLEIRCW